MVIRRDFPYDNALFGLQPFFFGKAPQHHQLLKNHSNTSASNQQQSTLIERYLLGTNMSPPIGGTFKSMISRLSRWDILTRFCRRVTTPLHQHFKNSPPATNPNVFHLDLGEVLYLQTTHPLFCKNVTLSEKSAPFPRLGQVHVLGLAANPCHCGHFLPLFRCACGLRVCSKTCQGGGNVRKPIPRFWGGPVGLMGLQMVNFLKLS